MYLLKGLQNYCPVYISGKLIFQQTRTIPTILPKHFPVAHHQANILNSSQRQQICLEPATPYGVLTTLGAQKPSLLYLTSTTAIQGAYFPSFNRHSYLQNKV